MAKRDELAANPSVSLSQIDGRRWILFERQLHPPVYDVIIQAAAQRGVRPRSIQHVIAPEEAFPFVSDGSAIAFVLKARALLMARTCQNNRRRVVATTSMSVPLARTRFGADLVVRPEYVWLSCRRTAIDLEPDPRVTLGEQHTGALLKTQQLREALAEGEA